MDLQEFLDHLNSGRVVKGDSPLHQYMHEASQQAIRLTARLNGSYHTPEEIIALVSELTGQELDPAFRLFPPFTTDCGRNITFGKRVFLNAGCRFQDQGGITIGDDCLLGHNAVLCTLNHGMEPENRKDLHPAPIVLKSKVWLGANVTVLPGVTIGENSVIAAGAVVTKDIPANVVAAGVPARVLKQVEPSPNI